MNNNSIETSLNAIKILIEEQISRAEKLNTSAEAVDFADKDIIKIGLIDGDGIGPIIMTSAMKVLEKLLADELASGKISFHRIKGLSLENRIAKQQTVPDEVMTEIKSCDILLKGPTTTPSKSDNLPNIESANVTLRRELDLFANVRPVKIPSKNIDWIFFRENTEGEYPLGSKGLDLSDDISMDFKVTTDGGTQRLAAAAFRYARANGNLKVSIITKANIIKKTDGRFLDNCVKVSQNFPDVPVDDWFVDIAAANLINDSINSSFNVFILPNLYGDIITDEAAQMQGGVGTAGSANIGNKYAMFEAIHGSAPRMLESGIAEYANPASLLSAAVMMLKHISMTDKADILNTAIEKASENLNMSGDGFGNTAEQFSDFIISALL